MITRAVRTAIDSIVSTGLDGSYSATETETRHFDTPSSLAVETTNGGVTVRGEDRDDVEVLITKRATDEQVLQRADVAASGGDGEPLSLRTEYDGPPGDVAVGFDIALPTDVPVASVRTKNGSVELYDATGDAELATENGAVTAERVDGYLDLRTKNGEITAREVTGVDRAESVNGSIELAFADLRTGASVGTKSGSVTVLAARSLDADVTLSTAMGSIDAPVLGESSSGLGKLLVSGTVGAGGHSLDVRTTLGSVEFRESGTARS